MQSLMENLIFCAMSNSLSLGTKGKSIVLDKRKSIFWEPVVTRASYLVHCDTLLQNRTDIITKFESYLIAKCNKSLLQNASGFLLQNTTVLLQHTTVIT